MGIYCCYSMHLRYSCVIFWETFVNLASDKWCWVVVGLVNAYWIRPGHKFRVSRECCARAAKRANNPYFETWLASAVLPTQCVLVWPGLKRIRLVSTGTSRCLALGSTRSSFWVAYWFMRPAFFSGWMDNSCRRNSTPASVRWAPGQVPHTCVTYTNSTSCNEIRTPVSEGLRDPYRHENRTGRKSDGPSYLNMSRITTAHTLQWFEMEERSWLVFVQIRL